MPKVSEFYGIQIVFYLHDHGIPHFHAFYSGRRASVRIESPALLEGSLPPRATRLVLEWGSPYARWNCSPVGGTFAPDACHRPLRRLIEE